MQLLEKVPRATLRGQQFRKTDQCFLIHRKRLGRREDLHAIAESLQQLDGRAAAVRSQHELRLEFHDFLHPTVVAGVSGGLGGQWGESGILTEACERQVRPGRGGLEQQAVRAEVQRDDAVGELGPGGRGGQRGQRGQQEHPREPEPCGQTARAVPGHALARRARTAAARVSSTGTVDSHEIQASVML